MDTDILILGAGAVGCAMAYRLARFQGSVTVAEQTYYVAGGATKANSAMLHSGLSTKPGSMRAQLVKGARAKVLEVCRELCVPVTEDSGLLTVAFDEGEHARLLPLLEDARRLGLHGALLSRAETLALEPQLNPALHSAFYSRDLSVVSPYELTIAMAENAALNGVEFLFYHRVTALRREGDRLLAEFENGTVLSARTVVNACGIHADTVAALLEDPGFTQHPRKGEYFLYDKNVGVALRHVVSVLGDEKSKGMVLVPTPHGNLLAGSSAADAEDREDTATTGETLEQIYRTAVSRLCPALPRYGKVITTFAGNRSVADTGDFVIKAAEHAPNFITAGGIQSPGLTCCLNIADYILERFRAAFAPLTLKTQYRSDRPGPQPVRDLNEAAANRLIATEPAYGEIVCRCEQVTKGEILDAIHGPIPCHTVDALKRKLRVGMGRCQGGFCLQRVLFILAQELGVPPGEVVKDLPGSAYALCAGGSDEH